MFYFIRSHANIISAVLLVLAIVAFLIYAYFGVILRKNDQSPVFKPVDSVIEIGVGDDVKELAGLLSATDREDGDVSDSIIVQSIGKFNDDMTRNITFAAFDSRNHTTLYTAKIKYTDYRSPEFYLSGPLTFTKNDASGVINMIGAGCVIDGDLSGKVKTESELDLETGVHPYTVSVENSAGDISRITLLVNIVDRRASDSDPSIKLDKYLIYLSAGDNFDPRSAIYSVAANCTYTETDEETGETVETVQELTKDDVVIDDGGFNSSVPGTYYIKYETANKLGKTATAYLTVVVR